MKFLRVLLVFFCCAYCVTAEAQVKRPRYFIYKTPYIVGKKKIDSVNRVIARMKDDEAVFTVLDNAFRDFSGVVFPIKKPVDEHTALYISYSIGAPKDIVRSLRWDKGTRGGNAIVIRHTDQFKAFFSDTLLIIDTLRLKLGVTDKKVNPGGYYFLAMQKNGVQKRVPIVYQDPELLIHKGLFPDTIRSFIPIVLKHTQLRAQLATSQIRFLGQADKDVIFETWQLIKELNKDNPEAAEMALVYCLHEYLQLQLGYINIENLLNLTRQYQ